ncbi:MAG: undecaprenyl/decaprenyl-phosphate alpha-N-acetylglucosaminyl 1-phosphate transferase [Bacteroidetes bacterium]|nr:undecaprenyl/decaprenyl-phosphate alpha-N-acetylglucosaminyl 1-phosphate transferase [Bacteroidota bacterium]
MNTLADILQIISALVISGVIVYITVPLLRSVAFKLDLYDKPDGDRKLHTEYVPTLGGIALFLAFFIGFSVSGFASQMQGYSYFAAAMLMLFFTGMKDDLVGLSPLKKLLVEVAVGMMLIFGSGIYISNFYGVLGIGELPFAVSVVITLFTMIVVVNAYNLIDGVDGLAGGIGVIASLFFGIGFFVAGDYAMAMLSAVVVATLSGYLLHNFHPASIFMGDTGSLIIGFLLAVQAIQFVGLNESVAFTTAFGPISSVMPVAILMIPLYDTLRVFILRAKRGDSPFDPGRDHIHHILIGMGMGHRKTSLTLYAMSIAITVTTYLFSMWNVNVLVLISVVLAVVVLPGTGLKRKVRGLLTPKSVIQTSSTMEVMGKSKVKDKSSSKRKSTKTEFA